jgi:glycosyltransferase involved in cell wall biosynthesis
MCADGCGPREYQVVAADGQVLTSGRAGESGEFAPSPWLKVPIGSRTIDMCVSAEASLSSGERRLIGLALGSVESRGLVTRITDIAQRRLTAAATRWAAEESLSNYDCVYRSYTRTTTNSRYTASWLRRWWGVDSEVIEPPVISRTLTSKAKRPEIVSVGRFFTEGHGKKQLDLVAAFRRLHKQDLRGWRLVLIGGADEPAYVDQVRAAARGLPVDIHTDVAEHQAEELKDRASVVWHAAGYGESPARHPGRFEHFGMAVAEGMAAGAVPVVLDGGGLREIVQHGLHGFRWRTIDELCEYTLRLVRDARLREDMGVAAKTHVQQWSLASYQDRVNALVQSAHEDVVAGAVR